MEIFGYNIEVTTTLTVFMIALLSWFIYKWQEFKRRNLPPGPRPWPFIGNPKYLYSLDSALLTGRELYPTYGPVCTVFLGETPLVLLGTPDVIHDVFVKHGSNFNGRPNQLLTMRLTNRNKPGVAWSNGDMWTRQRRLALHSMKDLGAVRWKLEESVHEELSYVIPLLEEHCGKHTNPFYIIEKAVSNIISVIIFGSRFEYDDEMFSNLLEMVRSVDKQVVRIDPISAVNYLPLMGILFGIVKMLNPSLKKTVHIVEQMTIHTAGVIAEHKKTYDSENIRDFMDLYIKMEQDSNKEGSIGEERMMRTVFDLYFAGTDTTAKTLSWALYHMISNPEVQQKCADEISEAVGFERTIKLSDMVNMPYNTATISEVQRICPVATHSLPHTATCDTKIQGYDIPEGTMVVADINNCAHLEEYWREPDKFRPEHFLDNNGKYKTNKAFIPFSTGPRMCLGDSMARSELFLFFTTLIQRFEFKNIEGQTLGQKGRMLFLHVPPVYSLIYHHRK